VPLKQRKEAYQDLQNLYPSYFGNLKFETSATKIQEDAQRKLTAEIIATARARAFADKITENAKKSFELESKRDELALQLKIAKSEQTSYADALGGSAEVRDIYTQQLDLQRQIRETKEEDLRLQKEITKEVIKGGKIIDTVTPKGAKAAKSAKPKLNTTSLPSLTGDGIGIGAVLQQLQAPITLPQVTVPTGLSDYIKLMQEAYYSNVRFGDSVKELGATALSSGISEAFSAIGQSLSDGTNAIDAFGTAILSAFSSFLNQLGQMFIKEGIAQIGYGIAQNLILPGSGANRIAGGAGMIAAGAAISILGGATKGGKSKKGSEPVKPIKGFATGVNNFSGGIALVGERGPELVNLPTGSSVMNNTSTQRVMERNNSEIVIGASIDFSMRKLVVEIDKERKLMGRSN